MDTSVNARTQTGVCPNCGKQFPQSVTVCPFDGGQIVGHSDPMIGVMLPRRYRITGKLGRGAMSVVYSGVYEPLEQPVAVKLLKSHLVSDLSTFKRFQQEAKTAGALEHPNIVGIFDFGVTDQGVPYLIMELLNGESLNERIKRSRGLSMEAVVSLFSQAADALHYTHERGIIHRDVKPSNILVVTENGIPTVKIVDFGIAKLQTMDGENRNVGELTATGEVFGTPLYVSPEQAMGRSLDRRADIYSLGCVMYEAIVGAPPFNAPNAFDVIRKQILEKPIPVEQARADLNLPPSLVVAVNRSMEKDPDDRYQTMNELLADLQKAAIELNALGGRLSSGKKRVLPAEEGPPRPQLRSTFPFMTFIIACVTGCLAGGLVLFCMDLRDKMDEQLGVETERTRPIIKAKAAARKPKPRAVPVNGDHTALAKDAEQHKNFDEAEQHYRDAIAAAETSFGRNDKRVATQVKNLAAYLHRRNRQIEAKALERRARDLSDNK